jgi:type II secretory pathway pseudopilin PulG
MSRVRRGRGQRGETLLELLVAITILGVCVVAIGSGIALAVRVSALHRSQATAGAYARSYAEVVESAATTSYVNCASTYSVSGFSAPSGFSAAVVGVKYWNGTGFQVGCPSPDQGLQQVTVQVADARASEQLVVVVRKP